MKIEARKGNLRDNFVPIYNELLDVYQEVIGYQSVAIYINIRRYISRDEFSKHNGKAYPSIDRLAKKMKMSKKTILKYIPNLEKVGLIEIHEENIKVGNNNIKTPKNYYIVNDPIDNISYEQVYQMFIHNQPKKKKPKKRDLKRKENEEKAKQVFEYWNNLILEIGLMKNGKNYTKEIAKIIKERLQEYNIEDLKKMLFRLSQNDFYCGGNDSQTVHFTVPETVFNKKKCATRIDNLEAIPVDRKTKQSQNKNKFNNFNQRIAETYTNDELEKMFDERSKNNNDNKKALEKIIDKYGSVRAYIDENIKLYGSEDHPLVIAKKEQLGIQ